MTVVITSFVGMFGVAGALNGFLFRRMNPLVRILFAGGGLLMMYPGTLTDVIGIVIFALAFAWQYLGYKRSAGAAA